MRLLVRLQDRRSGERLAAHPAAKRSLACMHPTVVLHVVPQLERLAAELALERPVTGVHRQVRYQRRHVRKAFTTELAQHHVALIGGGRIAGRYGGGLRSDGRCKLQLHWARTFRRFQQLVQRRSTPVRPELRRR